MAGLRNLQDAYAEPMPDWLTGWPAARRGALPPPRRTTEGHSVRHHNRNSCSTSPRPPHADADRRSPRAAHGPAGSRFRRPGAARRGRRAPPPLPGGRAGAPPRRSSLAEAHPPRRRASSAGRPRAPASLPGCAACRSEPLAHPCSSTTARPSPARTRTSPWSRSTSAAASRSLASAPMPPCGCARNGCSASGRARDVAFNATGSGQPIAFARWAGGERPKVTSTAVTWSRGAGADAGYASFPALHGHRVPRLGRHALARAGDGIGGSGRAAGRRPVHQGRLAGARGDGGRRRREQGDRRGALPVAAGAICPRRTSTSSRTRAIPRTAPGIRSAFEGRLMTPE